MLRFKWETEFKEAESGSMAKDWEERPIRSLVKSMVKGKTPKRGSQGTYEYPYLSVGYLRGEREPEEFCSREAGVMVNNDDLLIIWDGATNAGEILRGKKGILGSTLTRLELTDDCDPDFIYSALKFLEDEIRALRSGTDDRHVDRDALLDMLIPFPEKSEQNRIAEVLLCLSSLIENELRQDDILEKVATALFKQWFVDFEPFGQDEMRDSELGMIPVGWEVKPISKLANLCNGFSYNGREKSDEPIEGSRVFITLNNFIEDGGFKPEYAWVRSDRLGGKHFLKEGDLVLTNTHFGVGGSATGRLLATPALVVFPPDYAEPQGVFSHHITNHDRL